MHKSEEIILKDKNFDTKQGQNSTINNKRFGHNYKEINMT
jgi:hypothetical protein